MAEAQQATRRSEPSWKPGQYYVPGTPIPEGAIVVPLDNGLVTLQRPAREGFDKDEREKILRLIDAAYERSIVAPRQGLPEGMRPYELRLNSAARKLFPNVRQWGDLEPPCEVVKHDDADPRFNSDDAIQLEGSKAKAFFVTDPKEV